MSIILFNPTNERFEMVYSGRGIFLEAGGKLKVEDNCGKHLLSIFGIRGLTSLEFGDDEDKIAADAKGRNDDFKRKMVMDYNVRNAQRKQQGMAYLIPTKEVKNYSSELGLALDEPYAVRDLENERMAVLKKENDELRGMVVGLGAQMAELMKVVAETQAKDVGGQHKGKG